MLLFLLPPIIFLGVRWFVDPADRKRTGTALAVLLLSLPFLLVLIRLALECLSAHIHPRYDLYLFRIDQALGGPNYALAQFVAQCKPLLLLTAFFYEALTAAIMVTVLSAIWLYSQAEAAAVLRAFFVNLTACFGFYALFPAAGPRFAFATFPRVPSSVIPHVIALDAFPNCIPSVHLSSALLIYWFFRHWKLGRVVGVLCVIATVEATLATGEHYLIDLVLAFPYAAGVVWATKVRNVKPQPALEEDPASEAVHETSAASGSRK